MSSERWLPVMGFEGLYEVSSLGRVRGLARMASRKYRDAVRVRVVPARLMKPAVCRSHGYLNVALSRNGKLFTKTVHRIVCAAFHGAQPEGQECAHLDGNKTNNAADNLAWVSPSENQHHRVLHGTSNRGERAWNSKLRADDIGIIRKRRALGEQITRIASDYGVSHAAISGVVKGRRWQHIK